MKKKSVQIEIPLSIYELLQDIAQSSGWSFEDVILQTIKSGLPPSLGKVPVDFHEGLLALNSLGDRDLLRVVEGELPKNLPQGPDSADFKLLRQTYALRLLKWRGHPIPSPYETLVS
ncbi:MAG: hypothetical protein H6667_20460 [Ardenticatenaceae bacterium]|nr:hypothetical protein [Ardenticatenaceae bacterium]MCB9445573.1 hypothetical protein [Ardenticatenaceae bacterium]